MIELHAYRTLVVEDVALEEVVETAQVVVVRDQQHLRPTAGSLHKENILSSDLETKQSCRI